MDDAGAFDQAMIDEIVATAESDTIESRVANLEEEVTELKGSIKNLLMDIRETMGVLENPFQNIQGIATMSEALLSPGVPAEEVNELEPEEPEESEAEDSDEFMELAPENIFDNKKGVNAKKSSRSDSKLIDPLAFYKTIVWSKDMVERYDSETINELVEIFSLLGYIPEDIKDIVIKITEILDKEHNLDNAVMDLYRLYHILTPEDQSLDSKVLDYVLNENDTVKDLCLRK
ncbi:MAG: hypothetical protein PHU28_03700 [Methanosarcinaceae archaeon]|nr:hypothetical protein [Methanosarcinaceae archaeon]